MSDARLDLRREYAAALRDAAAGKGESALSRAYELGRKALVQGFSVMDLAEIHHKAAASILSARLRPRELRRTLSVLGSVLQESLSPSEMVQRGFKESMGELRSMSRVLENAVEGISRVDSRGRFVSVNKAYAAMAGYAPEELEGLPWRLLFHAEDRDKVSAARLGLNREEKTEAEVRAVRKDGSSFYCRILLIGADGRDGRPEGLHCFMRDVTEQKRAENERSRRLAEAAKVQALARANAELTEFARMLARDLREPVRTIISYMRLLLRRSGETLDEETGRFAARAEEVAAGMSQLIGDLLDYTRLETRPLRSEPVDLNDSVAAARANLRAAIAAAGARITQDSLPVLEAESGHLVQLFQNLLSNAIRFRGGNLPRIHISAHRGGRAWQFAVQDNGTGVDRRDAARLFTPFARLDPERSGHGIGLAACKRIVERHGGKIWFESEPGKGSTVRFTLGAARREALVKSNSFTLPVWKAP